MLLWFDTEYSHTDLSCAGVLQVGLVITDDALRPRVPEAFPAALSTDERRRHGVSIWIRPRADLVLSEFIRGQTVLLDRCQARGRDVAEVDTLLAEYVDAIVGTASSDVRQRPLLAGNSVHLDWHLAQRELPRFASRLHFRILDVTALKLEWAHRGGRPFEKDTPDQVRIAFPEADLEGDARHDAYYDAQASIAELAHYRRHWRIG